MKKFDVVGIGSALLDFIIEIDDNVLAEMDLKKGEMHLIDEKKSKEILKKLEKYEVKTAPGGSAANTLAGISALGGSAVFLGKIGKDKHGDFYEQKTNENGVNSRLSKHDFAATGHTITFITPDSERSFATHLGAALHFRKEDILEEDIKNSRILHIEGYQLEDPALKEAAVHAMKIAKANNVKISVDLADPALIGRNLEPLKKLVKDYVDIIFVNEKEAEAFTGKKEEEALHEIYDMCEIAVVKLGEKGSLVKADGMIYRIPINKIKVVNTNGAGDAYAAGILYSIAKNIDMEKAGKIAAYISSQVVASAGARLNKSLKEEIKKL
jgi:sugar/nucleoside kinase (ribokinase family)